jgi:hypothetical protein
MEAGTRPGIRRSQESSIAFLKHARTERDRAHEQEQA